MSKIDDAFDHPCKDTCSGWKQGYDKGYRAALDGDPGVRRIVGMLSDLEKCFKYGYDIQPGSEYAREISRTLAAFQGGESGDET